MKDARGGEVDRGVTYYFVEDSEVLKCVTNAGSSQNICFLLYASLACTITINVFKK